MRCSYCGTIKNIQLHHIIPKSKGGTDDPSNLRPLCVNCHSRIHGHGTGKIPYQYEAITYEKGQMPLACWLTSNPKDKKFILDLLPISWWFHETRKKRKTTRRW